MVNTSLKRRRTEEQLRGKVPKKEKKKVKKQKYYHSSSEDEGGARDAPIDEDLQVRRKALEPFEKPFEPSGANAIPSTRPKPNGPSVSPAKSALGKKSLEIEVNNGVDEGVEQQVDSPADDEEDELDDAIGEADEFDVEDSESDLSDNGSVSDTSTAAARKVRKRNDPNAFATSISKILNTKLTTTKRSEPILSRSKDAEKANKELADSKLTEKARRQIVAEKKAARDRGRIKDVLGLHDPEVSTAETTAKEKELRRTAQKGVIKLFNAVRAAQVKGEQAERDAKAQNVVGIAKREETVKEMSKQGFLDMITNGTKKDTSVTV